MEKALKIVFGIIFVLFFHPVFASNGKGSVESVSKHDWHPVIEAIIQVESEGKSDAKRGASVGVLQITPVMVAECNNILKQRKSKKRYTLADRRSRQKSIEMFLLFQSWFNPKHDIELAIRSWNGGMHYSLKRTQRYFEKVMKILQNS